MNSSRLEIFARELQRLKAEQTSIEFVEPVACTEGDLEGFHTKRYVEQVKEVSMTGEGQLGNDDTPAFKGVYEASLVPVGSTLRGLRMIMEGDVDHFFNPVGGLHHSSPDEARGFCVFNDSVIAISRALVQYKLRSVAYVDMDAHHGDGVFYEFEPDPRVVIGDIHEHGRFLYPGTGDENETGKGFAAGTKLNIGLLPGSGDKEFIEAFDRLEEFVRRSKPEMIFFQCGADGLAGDPIADLNYTSAAHAHAAGKLHRLAHDICGGRMLAMGGGGYNPDNVAAAWTAVIGELLGGTQEKS